MNLSRLIAALAAMLLAAPAAADSAELAARWSADAAHLYDRTLAVGSSTPSTDYLDDVARFGAMAARLAAWIDTGAAPADFGCIVRGMSDEAALQLDALESGPDARIPALERLVTLFSDAELVGVSVASASRRGAGGEPSASCPANPQAVVQYLTEQP